MNETEILNILSDWNYWGNFREEPRPRTAYLARLEQLLSDRTATVVLGVRRAGKSSLIARYIYQNLEGKLLDAKNTLIINFEDPRFYLPLSSNDLFRVYETYLKNLNPSDPLMVLDEVQNVQGWEKFVRYLLEAKRTRVIVTGSSSKMLGQELSTVLTGRHVDMEVFPLDFREYLHFKGVELADPVALAGKRIEIRRLFDEYVQWGGFPEVIISDSLSRKQELLTRYFEDIIIKDVVKRFGVKEIQKLEQLAALLLANISTLRSFNKLKDKIGVSLDTVERFAGYLESARIFFQLKKFDFSLGRQIRSISKMYGVDSGLYTAKGFKFSENYGRVAENLVAVELFRRRSFHPELEIYYWKDYQQREVDFVVKSGANARQLIQVCWSVEEEKTKKREVHNLLRAGSELSCDDLLAITGDYEAEEAVSQNGITKMVRFIPLWKWLLNSF